MELSEFAALATSYDAVREQRRDGLLRWQRNGRLLARQLDETHVVIRAAFDVRDVLAHGFPETFSVPTRFQKHMMVVANLRDGDPTAIEEALEAAWRLQGEDTALEDPTGR